MGEEVRKKACEKLGRTMKRKGEGEGSSEPKKKFFFFNFFNLY